MTTSNIDGVARDTTMQLLPKFDQSGLLTAVVIDSQTKDVLMLAHMNQQALDETISSGFAHFYSRSRQSLWKKGETSGNVLEVKELRIDCDQDAVLVYANPHGPACHTGETSCFFRRIAGQALVKVNT